MPKSDKPQPNTRPAIDQIHRVDGPHLTGPTVEETAEVSAATLKAAAGLDEERNQEQFRAQAAQVARHLRQRRTEIDRREAELNARISQLESEVRVSRLWMHERNHEFEQRENELQNEVSELRSRLQTVAAVEVADEQQRSRAAEDLTDRRRQLELDQQRLAAGQQRLAQEAEDMSKTRLELREHAERQQRETLLARQTLIRAREAVAERERQMLEKLRQHRESLEQRERQLLRNRDRLQQDSSPQTESHDGDSDARRLDAQQRNLAEARQRLRDDTRQAHQASVAERERIAEIRRTAQEQAQAVRTALDVRRQELERRETSLVQLKSQVSGMYQEVLEMRLVTEQLWGEVRESVSPAQLTRSLGQLRVRLADQYRFAQQQLVADRKELQQLAARLDTSRASLVRQRDEFHAWATRRQQEAEAQAARLVAQENKLLRDQGRLRKLPAGSSSV